MFESATTESNRKPTHHLGWFLIGGATGLLIAIFFSRHFGQTVLPERIFLTLWPLGIGLMAVDHATISTAALAIVIVYGSNFVLYGLASMLISLSISFIRSLTTSSD